MSLSNLISLPCKNPLRDWSTIAGIAVLIVVVALSFINHTIGSPLAWLTLGVVLVYGFLSWGIELADITILRHLRIAILTSLSMIVLFVGEGGFGAALLFFVLSAAVMYMAPARQGYLWIIIFGLIILFAYLTVWAGNGGVIAALATFAGFLFFGSNSEAQIKAQKASGESTRLLGELQLAHQKLQDQADQAEELAAINERNHLAREVHDTLGHQLTVAAVQLEGAQKLIQRDPAKAEAMVATVREQVLEGLSELRRTIATLRAPIEEDLSLPTMLGRLVENFEEATDIKTELSLPPSLPELPSAHRQTIFRAVQESLTNIQKHAHAQSAQIRLFVQGQPGNQNAILLSIRDDGIGISEKSRGRETGFGLRGMNERVSQLDGTISIHDGTTGGTEVLITIPISAANGIPKE